MPGLNARQQRFVDEYLVDLNATAAAIRAGYSQKTAGSIGQENLKKPEIAAAIKEGMRDREERTEITQDLVVQEAYKLYRLCSRKIPKIDFTGEQIIDNEGRPVFKPVDGPTARGALDMLMKHTGAYAADNKRELAGGIEFVWAGEKNGNDS